MATCIRAARATRWTAARWATSQPRACPRFGIRMRCGACASCTCRGARARSMFARAAAPPFQAARWWREVCCCMAARCESCCRGWNGWCISRSCRGRLLTPPRKNANQNTSDERPGADRRAAEVDALVTACRKPTRDPGRLATSRCAPCRSWFCRRQPSVFCP